jgi:hypothetical protein
MQAGLAMKGGNRIYLLTYLLSYWLTYSLTPWCRFLLEKLTGSQLVKKFPAFYGTRRFITAFTSARYLSLSWARLIQYIPKHTTSWMSVLISSHLCLGLPSGLLPLMFLHQNPVHTSPVPHTCYMPSPSNIRKKAQEEDKTSHTDCSKYSLVSSVFSSSWSPCLSPLLHICRITFGSLSFPTC